MQSQDPAVIGVSSFDDAPSASAEWIIGLQTRLGWQDRRKVYMALLAVLHALRDHLSADEVASLGAGLPSLLRGLYYEGWHPRVRPLRLDDRQSFLARVHEVLHQELGIDPEQVTRAVFELLSERVPATKVEEVRGACPTALHGLWPH